MIIGPYTVSRGTLLPWEEEAATKQKWNEALDGSVGVVDDYAVTFIKGHIIVPWPEAMDIKGFLENGMRFAATVFILEDSRGIQHSVRWWQKRVRAQERAVDQCKIDLLFRVEV
jgi:hypothetical protein